MWEGEGIPREVEEIMYNHPSVGDAVLIPQKDPNWEKYP